MKCRIIKRCGKFIAEYENKGEWKILKRRIRDQRDGDYEVGYFESVESAERALRSYAELKEEKIVKEFEV